MPFTSMTRRLAVLLLTLSSYAQWQKGIRFAPIGTSGGSAISPDSKTLAFAGLIEKREDQFDIRAIDSIEARASRHANRRHDTRRQSRRILPLLSAVPSRRQTIPFPDRQYHRR